MILVYRVQQYFAEECDDSRALDIIAKMKRLEPFLDSDLIHLKTALKNHFTFDTEEFAHQEKYLYKYFANEVHGSLEDRFIDDMGSESVSPGDAIDRYVNNTYFEMDSETVQRLGRQMVSDAREWLQGNEIEETQFKYFDNKVIAKLEELGHEGTVNFVRRWYAQWGKKMYKVGNVFYNTREFIIMKMEARTPIADLIDFFQRDEAERSPEELSVWRRDHVVEFGRLLNHLGYRHCYPEIPEEWDFVSVDWEAKKFVDRNYSIQKDVETRVGDALAAGTDENDMMLAILDNFDGDREYLYRVVRETCDQWRADHLDDFERIYGIPRDLEFGRSGDPRSGEFHFYINAAKYTYDYLEAGKPLEDLHSTLVNSGPGVASRLSSVVTDNMNVYINNYTMKHDIKFRRDYFNRDMKGEYCISRPTSTTFKVIPKSEKKHNPHKLLIDGIPWNDYLNAELSKGTSLDQISEKIMTSKFRGQPVEKSRLQVFGDAVASWAWKHRGLLEENYGIPQDQPTFRIQYQVRRNKKNSTVAFKLSEVSKIYLALADINHFEKTIENIFSSMESKNRKYYATYYKRIVNWFLEEDKCHLRIIQNSKYKSKKGIQNLITRYSEKKYE